ncbi:phosphoethanolamine transferase, partial [uncultured Porphyromonas sp.]|uniref:phosphoethanolamine transferase n=1 Tax=uncultured Porphyromonas sp. TaxID=159274 RepID=UPI0026104C01
MRGSSLIDRVAHVAFGRRLSERLWLFALVFLAQLRVLLAYIPYQTEVPSSEVLPLVLDQLLRIGGWASLLTLLFALAPWKWLARSLGALFAGATLLLSAYELYLIGLYHVTYNMDLAQIMLSTNWREGSEFLDSITADQAIAVLLQLLPAASFAFLTCLFTKKHPVLFSLFGYITGTALILLGPVVHLPSDLAYYKKHISFTGLYTSGIDRLIYNTLGAHDATKRIAEEQAKIRDSQRAVEALTIPRPISKKPLNVILILGESARRSSMHCYGYPLENTPYADSLLQAKELLAFTDVVSPATATILSNTRSLTFFTYEEGQKPWYQFPSLIQVLRQAGYATAWIANQEITGEYSISNLLGRQADILTGNPSFFKGLGGEGVSDRPDLYDEAILPLLYHYDSLPDSLRSTSPLGLFQVVHLMGSHMTYGERYPEAFARFSPDSLPERKDERKDEIISGYVNSLLYTDHIIHEIIQTYREENALVIYLSDHGDALFDEDYPELMGHALVPKAVEIPLFVYFSPRLRKERPDLWRQLSRQRDKRILSDLLTHAVVDLLGIHTEYTQPRF